MISQEISAQPTIRLVKSSTLPGAFSVTALEYYENTLMVIGRNATKIFLMNNEHKMLDSLSLFDYPDLAAVSDIRTGMQATAIISLESKPVLLIMGSGQTSATKSDIWLLPLKSRNYSQIYIASYAIPDFYRRLKKSGLKEIDIEGSAQIKDRILLANNSEPDKNLNHLVSTEFNFWSKGATATFQVIQIEIPQQPLLISGLEYDKNNDVLFFSAVKSSSAKDPRSGMVGYIQHASRKLDSKKIRPDGLFDLASASDEFKGKSISSICVEPAREQGTTYLHVCSAAADGSSAVYKLKLSW